MKKPMNVPKDSRDILKNLENNSEVNLKYYYLYFG